MSDQSQFKAVLEAIEATKRGEFVVLMDDEGRENEGDLVIAAERITPKQVNFIIREARGLLCISIDQSMAERLALPQMVEVNQDTRRTKFTVSIDANEVSTGISAYERHTTIAKMVDPGSEAGDFVRPGHIFPILVDEGGLLSRHGHTEASYELATLAGYTGGSIICEIVRDDGEMAREKDLRDFAAKHKLCFLKIAELIEYKKHILKLSHEPAN